MLLVLLAVVVVGGIPFGEGGEGRRTHSAQPYTHMYIDELDTFTCTCIHVHVHVCSYIYIYMHLPPAIRPFVTRSPSAERAYHRSMHMPALRSASGAGNRLGHRVCAAPGLRGGPGYLSVASEGDCKVGFGVV